MNEDMYADLQPIVAKVAGKQSKRFKGYGADADDLQQECWLWAMKSIDTIKEWQKSAPDRWQQKVGFSMQNACKEAGQRAKAQARGYSRDDLIGLVTDTLRETLLGIYGDEAIEGLEYERVEAESERVRDPRSAVDARWAYEQLDDEDRDILDAFYRDGCRNKEMAESRGVSEQTMSDLHRRALRRLALTIGEPPDLPNANGDFEGWSGRRSISSSRMRAMQEGAYDDPTPLNPYA